MSWTNKGCFLWALVWRWKVTLIIICSGMKPNVFVCLFWKALKLHGRDKGSSIGRACAVNLGLCEVQAYHLVTDRFSGRNCKSAGEQDGRHQSTNRTADWAATTAWHCPRCIQIIYSYHMATTCTHYLTTCKTSCCFWVDTWLTAFRTSGVFFSLVFFTYFCSFVYLFTCAFAHLFIYYLIVCLLSPFQNKKKPRNINSPSRRQIAAKESYTAPWWAALEGAQ